MLQYDGRNARQLIGIAIDERDQISAAMHRDSHDSKYQRLVVDWAEGRSEGFFPSGALAELLDTIRPRLGYGAFDRALQLANADALNAPAAAFLLPKLEAVGSAHKKLRDAAFAVSQSESSRFSAPEYDAALESHCHTLTALIDVVNAVRPSNNEAAQTNGNVTPTSDTRTPRKCWGAKDYHSVLNRTESGFVLQHHWPMFDPNTPPTGNGRAYVPGVSEPLSARGARQWLESNEYIVPDDVLDETDAMKFAEPNDGSTKAKAATEQPNLAPAVLNLKRNFFRGVRRRKLRLASSIPGIRAVDR